MDLKTLLRIVLAGLLLGCACAAGSAQDPGSDDLGAAARKAREQQKAAPKPKKVVTNDDIPSKPAETPAPPANAATDGQEAVQSKGEQASKDENDPKKEAYWHKKYTQTHDKLAQAEKDLDV